jgi:hypothetical protein
VTDITPSRSVSALPIISGEQFQHVGRYAGAVVLSVFEQIGGAARMADWADSNPTDFYTKLFPKLIAKSQQIDVSGSITIDDAISRLEGQYEEVFDL